MENHQKFDAESYKARRCIFELEGMAVNPYHLIERMEYQECNRAAGRIVPRIGGALAGIQELLESIPILSEARRRYYTAAFSCGSSNAGVLGMDYNGKSSIAKERAVWKGR